MTSSDDPEQLNMQSLEALALANAVRQARSADKKRIAWGTLDPAAVLRNPPSHWRTATVVDLLMAIRSVGEAKILRWLSTEMISSGRRIEDLTAAQRERLARTVEVWSR